MMNKMLPCVKYIVHVPLVIPDQCFVYQDPTNRPLFNVQNQCIGELIRINDSTSATIGIYKCQAKDYKEVILDAKPTYCLHLCSYLGLITHAILQK